MAPLCARHATGLVYLNLLMFALHAGWSAVVLALSNLRGSVTLYSTNFTAMLEEAPDMSPRYSEAGQLRLAWITAFFFLVTAAAHLGSGWIWRGAYLNHLSMAQNPYRWIEYFLSASAMMLAIAYSAGVRDLATLVAVAALTASTMGFGWLHEVQNRPHEQFDAWTLPLSSRVQAHLLGWIPMAVAWYITLDSFFRATSATRPPFFVYLIVVGQALSFATFILPQLYQVLSPPSRYIGGEFAYQVLSLAAKSFLGGVLLGYVLVVEDFSQAMAGQINEMGSGTL